MRTKAHRLTFRLEYLEAVLSGSKRCTVRFSKVAARVQQGDALTLAFGRYDRPTVLTAIAARAEHFDLTQFLADARQIDSELDNLTAEEVRQMDAAEIVMQGWMPEDHREFWRGEGVPEVLLEALGTTGSDFNDVLLEAEGRSKTCCTVLWWHTVCRS